METRKDKIFKNTEEYKKFEQAVLGVQRWTPRYVKCAIEAKKASRANKGEVFNCFILIRPTIEKEEEGDDFVNFCKLLNENLDKFEIPTRFELAVYNESKYHWTAFDCLIKDGKFYATCIDAASDVSGDESFKTLKNYIAKDKCNVKLLVPDPNPYNEKMRRLIQTDWDNCALMTLEHVFMLSKRKEFLSFPEIVGDKISPVDLIKKAPELYRMTQQLLTIDSFKEQRKKDKELKKALDQPVSTKDKKGKKSKKGMTLFEYVDKYTDPGKNSRNEIVLQNKAIEHKIKMVKANILKFVGSLTVEEAIPLINPKQVALQEEWKQFLTKPKKEISFKK